MRENETVRGEDLFMLPKFFLSIVFVKESGNFLLDFLTECGVLPRFKAEGGFGVSFKANYSKEIIQKNERVPDIFFNEKDIKLLKNNDEVFSGTINSLLKPFGIYTQEIFLNGNEITFIVSNAYYRNQNLASKRIVQVTKDILLSRKINKVSIIFQSANLNTNKISFPLNKFISFLRNEYSILEIKRHIEFLNFQKIEQKYSIFKGNIDFPVFSWIVSPDFKNHIGAPEAFYSGQVGVNFDASISFSKSTYLDGKISLSLYNNMDQLRLRAYSKLPKVRSDIREYLKEGSSALSRLSLTHIFEPIYLKNGLFSSAVASTFSCMFEDLNFTLINPLTS